MIESFQLPVAMWQAQYRLLGGPYRMLFVVGGYVALVVVCLISAYRLFRSEPADVIPDHAMTLLVYIQCGALVFGGLGALNRALVRDYETRMIESHRLTPMSNLAVPLGFLFGATLHILMIAGANLIIGALLSIPAKRPLFEWLIGNLMLLNGILPVWTLYVFVGLRPGKPLNPALIMFPIALLMIPATFLIPAASVMLGGASYLLGASMMYSGTPTAQPAILLAVSVFTTAMTLFWLFMAAMKYRRPDLPALNGVWGLVLLAMFVLSAIINLVVVTRPGTGLPIPMELDGILTSTAIVPLLVALVPIYSAVVCRTYVRADYALRNWTDRISDVVVLILAAAMCAGTVGAGVYFNLNSGGALDSTNLLPRTLCMVSPLLALITAHGLFAATFPLVRSKQRFLIPVALVAFWIVPAMFDAIRMSIIETDLSALFAVSPIGTISMLFNGSIFRTDHIVFGVGFQALVAAIAAGAAMLSRKRSAATPATS